MKDIYVVIVTYNGMSFIEKCLDSIRESSIPVNVLVIDNASTDATLQTIKEKFKEVKLFELTENLGFGKANNIGIKYAYDNGAMHTLLLNQDAYVDKNCIKELALLQKKKIDFGILSPVHLRGDKEKLDSRFAYLISNSHDKYKLMSDLLMNYTMKEIYQVDFVNAAIWMLSRKCIEQVGLFNPSFHHYGEDRDYAQRVNYHDLLIGIAPGHTALHDRDQSSMISMGKEVLQKRADLMFRLSRLKPSIMHNLVSVIFRSLILSYHGKVSPVKRLKQLIVDFIWLIINLKSCYKNRKIARRGGRCFFKDADSNSKRFLKHPK